MAQQLQRISCRTFMVTTLSQVSQMQMLPQTTTISCIRLCQQPDSIYTAAHPTTTTLAQQDRIADNRTTVNVLGLLWTTDTDTLSLNPKESTSTQHTLITKRNVLKNVSRLFDPLGFVTPITMLFKVFYKSCGNTNSTGKNPYLMTSENSG